MTNNPESTPEGEEESKVNQNGSPETIETELDKFKREAAEYKDKYLRALAESENARKRLTKEKQEVIQYATQNLMAEFLHPMDHLENALRFTSGMSDEVKHWAMGFQMILNQFKDVLANNGATVIEAKGKQFDPHFHEAVEMLETNDVPPGTVVEEFIKGYKMGDRLIRAARVRVAKTPIKEKQEEQNKKQV